MNLFQSIVLAIFGFLAVAAVVIFSMTSSRGGSINYAGTFIVWCTLPEATVKDVFDNFSNANSSSYKVQYVEKKADTFETDLVSSLASGDGPDLIFMPQSLIISNRNKILPIGYDLYSARNFSDDFTDGAAIFANKDGIIGMPLYVDPLVMYWNKDLFSSAGVVSFPTHWSEFDSLASKLTKSSSDGNISQSLIAMGSYSNIEHVKDILASLFLQSGNEIVRFAQGDELNSAGGQSSYSVQLGNNISSDSGTVSALKFFLDFSNPVKRSYSWNTALPNSKTVFAGGTSAIYLGLSSDYSSIRLTNPHLNFDVANLPQRDGSPTRVTYGNFYGVAVTRGTKNPAVAKQIAIDMSDGDFVKSLADAIALPPARRDLLSGGNKDLIQSVFYSSAIISKSWLDPMPTASDQVFQDMIQSAASGSKTEGEILIAAGQKLQNLVKANN